MNSMIFRITESNVNLDNWHRDHSNIRFVDINYVYTDKHKHTQTYTRQDTKQTGTHEPTHRDTDISINLCESV